jgi:hypothetical protein
MWLNKIPPVARHRASFILAHLLVMFEAFTVREEQPLNDVMTIAEIESQFNSEWVLLESPQTDDQLHVVSGKVVSHSKDRDEVYRKAVELRPKRSAIIYTGTMPDGTAIVL